MKTQGEVCQPRFRLPKGRYYIGDPTYILNDQALEKVSEGLRRASRERQDGFIVKTNKQNSFTQLIVCFKTKYKEGLYRSSEGNSYGINSGLLCIVDVLSNCFKDNLQNNLFITENSFDGDFTAQKYMNSVVRFNKIRINTGA